MLKVYISTKRINERLSKEESQKLINIAISQNPSGYIFDYNSEEFESFRLIFFKAKNIEVIKKTIETSQKDKMKSNGRSKKDQWDVVSHTWNKAHNFILSMTSRLLEGKVSKEVKSLRILSCHGLDENGKQVKSACYSRGFSNEKKYSFCNRCGCGQRELARISSFGSTENQPLFKEDEYIKLDYPHLACPRKMPGFSNYDGDENILE